MTGSLSLSSVSVVIPTHRTRDLTLRCLASLPQGLGEVIVVDEASEDGTVEAIQQRFPAVRLIHNPRPLRFTRAVNQGVAESTGEIVLLLNSDTELEAGPGGHQGLHALLRAFEERPRLAVAGAQLCDAEGKPQWSGAKAPGFVWFLVGATRLPEWPPIRKLRSLTRKAADGSVDWVSGAAMAVRRRVWDEHGPFDERFEMYAQDLDFCLRVGADGWNVEVCPEFNVEHDREGTIGNQSLRWKWPDLRRWAIKRQGVAFERRVVRALSWGSGLRLCALRVRRWCPWNETAHLDAAIERVVEARRRLRRPLHDGSEPPLCRTPER